MCHLKSLLFPSPGLLIRRTSPRSGAPISPLYLPFHQHKTTSSQLHKLPLSQIPYRILPFGAGEVVSVQRVGTWFRDAVVLDSDWKNLLRIRPSIHTTSLEFLIVKDEKHLKAVRVSQYISSWEHMSIFTTPNISTCDCNKRSKHQRFLSPKSPPIIRACE